ncbi:MAG: hypothetical protein FWE94_02220 [Coriobacteriia bacterium]|nr:hypothetical protein [Coriobacteriia bacterium]
MDTAIDAQPTAPPVTQAPTSPTSPPPSAPAASAASPQPAYAPPQQPQPTACSAPLANSEPLSVGSYIGIFILSAIPLVGLIVLLVWAFSSSTNLNRKNYARATLILSVICIAVSFLLGALVE